jgi:hypothetical protein
LTILEKKNYNQLKNISLQNYINNFIRNNEIVKRVKIIIQLMCVNDDPSIILVNLMFYVIEKDSDCV